MTKAEYFKWFTLDAEITCLFEAGLDTGNFAAYEQAAANPEYLELAAKFLEVEEHFNTRVMWEQWRVQR